MVSHFLLLAPQRRDVLFSDQSVASSVDQSVAAVLYVTALESKAQLRPALEWLLFSTTFTPLYPGPRSGNPILVGTLVWCGAGLSQWKVPFSPLRPTWDRL